MRKRKEYTKFAFSNSHADKNTLVGHTYKDCQIINDKLTSALTMQLCRNSRDLIISLPSGNSFVKKMFCLYIRKSGNMVPHLAVLLDNNKMYYYDESLDENRGGWAEDYNFGTDTNVTYLQEEGGTHRTVFFNEKGAYYYATGIASTTTGKVTNVGCYHCGRVFISVGKGKIIYSSPHSASNYDVTLENGGYLFLPMDKGEVCALVSFRGTLYAFCEYGIFSINAVGSARDFTVKPVAYNGEKIMKNTVTVCGEHSVCFVTFGGILSFDGSEIKRIAKNIIIAPNKKENESNSRGVFYCGRYHVSFSTELYLADNIMVDLQTGEGCYVSMPQALSVINGVAYCAENNELKTVGFGLDSLPRNVKGTFSANVNFDTIKRKTLRRIWVKGDGTFQVSISAGNATKSMDCSAYKEAPRCYDVNLSAETFVVSVEMSGKTLVDSIVFEYETIE